MSDDGTCFSTFFSSFQISAASSESYIEPNAIPFSRLQKINEQDKAKNVQVQNLHFKIPNFFFDRYVLFFFQNMYTEGGIFLVVFVDVVVTVLRPR